MSNTDVKDNELITLRDIIFTTKRFIVEYFRSWVLVLFIGLPIIGLFYYNFTHQETTYLAQNKFLIEGASGTGGGLGAILSQIGAKGQGGKFNPWKVTETAKSKKTIKEILFQKYDNEFIINHIIDLYSLDKVWGEGNPNYIGFRFKNKDFEEFSYLENVAVSNIINKVLGGKAGVNGMMIFTYDNESAIFSYLLKTNDEKLSYELASRSYEWLRNFFENEMMESQLGTSKIIKMKTDSIKSLIITKTYEAASLQDQSQGLVLAAPNSKKVALEREVMALTGAYGELMKTFENTDVNIRDTKPMFLILDEPLLPLEKDVPSLLMSLIKGIILSVILTFLITTIRLVVRDALA